MLKINIIVTKLIINGFVVKRNNRELQPYDVKLQHHVFPPLTAVRACVRAIIDSVRSVSCCAGLNEPSVVYSRLTPAGRLIHPSCMCVNHIETLFKQIVCSVRLGEMFVRRYNAF